MLVNLKNCGVGARIVYDIHTKPVEVNPGQTKENVDLPDRLAARLKKAFDEGDPLEIASQGEAFASVEGSSVTFTGTQPQTQAEAEGHDGMPQQAHENDSGDISDAYSSHYDPVAHAAKVAAENDALAEEMPEMLGKQPDDPATATELIGRIGEFGQEKLIELANRVLRKGTLTQAPSIPQVMAALQHRAQEESREGKKTESAGKRSGRIARVQPTPKQRKAAASRK